MLHIKQVYDQEDLLALGNLKMELMQYHLEYAAQIGINDKELLQYTLEQALSTVPSRDNFIFLVDGEIVGISQVEEQVSAVDDSPFCLCMVFTLDLMPAIIV